MTEHFLLLCLPCPSFSSSLPHRCAPSHLRGRKRGSPPPTISMAPLTPAPPCAGCATDVAAPFVVPPFPHRPAQEGLPSPPLLPPRPPPLCASWCRRVSGPTPPVYVPRHVPLRLHATRGMRPPGLLRRGCASPAPWFTRPPSPLVPHCPSRSASGLREGPIRLGCATPTPWFTHRTGHGMRARQGGAEPR